MACRVIDKRHASGGVSSLHINAQLELILLSEMLWSQTMDRMSLLSSPAMLLSILDSSLGIMHLLKLVQDGAVQRSVLKVLDACIVDLDAVGQSYKQAGFVVTITSKSILFGNARTFNAHGMCFLRAFPRF